MSLACNISILFIKLSRNNFLIIQLLSFQLLVMKYVDVCKCMLRDVTC